MVYFRQILAALVAAILVSSAPASMLFSNIVVGGSLSAGATYPTGSADIDFMFPSAVVIGPGGPPSTGDVIFLAASRSNSGSSQSTMMGKSVWLLALLLPSEVLWTVNWY